MLSIRFQSINIVNKLGSDCGNGANIYVSMSGLIPGNTYQLSIEQISDYGESTFYYVPYKFLAASNELNNYLIKAVLLNSRYFILKAKITDEKNNTIFSEDATTVDCLTTSIQPTETPPNTPEPTPTQTTSPTYSQTPTETPPITPSAQAFGVCIGTDKSLYSLDCCSGAAYSQHHKLVIGLVNLIPDNDYTISLSSDNNYIKTYIAESNITPIYSNRLIDLYVSLNKNNTECAENKVTVTVRDDSNTIVATRDIDIYCILSDSQMVPDSYVCDNAVGVYFEDVEDHICLHFDDSCPRYAGMASVVPNFTPTPTQTKTPTVTPTYSRTPTIAVEEVSTLEAQSNASIMATEGTINLKTQIADNYDIFGANYKDSSVQINDSITHQDYIYLTGRIDCFSYSNPPKTSGFISRVILGDQLDKDISFGNQGIATIPLNLNSQYNSIKIIESQAGVKIMAFGSVGDSVIISRLNNNGSEDNSFADGGHLILNSIHGYRINSIFDIYTESNNNILLFTNAVNQDNNKDVILLIKVDFNGNVIHLNESLSFLEILPPLQEFNYSKLYGKKILVYKDNLYISFEAFSAVSKNTIITTKIDNQYNIDSNFGESGFVYSYNNSTKDHSFIDMLIEPTVIVAATKDDFNGYTETDSGSYKNFNFQEQSYDLINIFVVDSNHRLSIQKYSLNGKSYTTRLISTEPVSNDITVSVITDNAEEILHSQDVYENFANIFEETHIPKNIFSIDGNNATVEYVANRVRIAKSNSGMLLPINIKVSSVEGSEDPGSVRDIRHFEQNSLIVGQFAGNGLRFRNCQIMPCDRQPEDSYGSLIVTNQKINKFINSDRIYFGYILLSNNLSTINGLRIDNFDILNLHNIVNSSHVYGDRFLVCGNSGIINNLDLYIKSISLQNTDIPSYGPYLTDIVYNLNFNNICGLNR